MKDCEQVSLETNIYGVTHTPPGPIYQFNLQMVPSRNALRNQIVQKFYHINKPQLLECSFVKDDTIYSTRPSTELYLKTNVYLANQSSSTRIRINCQPISDATGWLKTNVVELLNHFWVQHYANFGWQFYDSSHVLATLEQENSFVVAGFTFFLDKITKNELKIKPRACCIQKSLSRNGRLFTKVINAKSLSKVDFEAYKACNVLDGSYLDTVVQKLLSTGLTRFGIGLEKKIILASVLSRPPMIPSNPKNSFYKVPEDSFKWALFSFDPRISESDLEQFKTVFTARAHHYGLDFDQCLYCRNLPINSIEQVFNIFDNLANEGIRFVMLGFAFDSGSIDFKALFYSSKLRLNQHLLPSQIVVTNEFNNYCDPEMGLKLLDKLLIKLNIKLGGIVNILDLVLCDYPLDATKTMLVGATVGFRESRDRCTKVVAALAATIDPQWSKYEAEICLNHDTHVHITELESMLTSLLEKYRIYNGNYPINLILFRHHLDTEVCSTEWTVLDRVMSTLGISSRIAFIVATNFHDVRFQPVNGEHGSAQDLLINHNFDHLKKETFYLFSQNHRSTRYTIFGNQLGVSGTHLRQLCLDLSYFAVRSFEANRYAAPLEIAVRQATKAMRHLEAKVVINNNETLSKDALQQVLNGVIQINFANKESTQLRL